MNRGMHLDIRKFAIISGLSLTSILFFGILIGTNIGQPPEWENELNLYLEFKNSLSSEKKVVQSVAKAGFPWAFQSGMSEITFGESPYFQTDLRYETDRDTKSHESNLPKEWTSDSLIPLPYPPEEVWCIELASSGDIMDNRGVPKPNSIVLVAEHMDLYNADYVVHEPPIGKQEYPLDEIMTRIGCDPS
jgi:hypothetical protein